MERPPADRLAAIEATVAILQARVSAHEAALRRRRARRSRRALPALALATLVALVPLGLLAANPFTDLTGGVHDADIAAIYDAGITKGCDPVVAYCPEALVTRQEMASFIARAAGLGSNPPVARARTAQSAMTAAHAKDADTVAGYAPRALARVARGRNATVVTLTSAPADVATLTLTAPAAGFILANGTMGVINTKGCPCYVTMWLSTNTSEEVGHGVDIGANGGFENLAATWVFPVGPGTHTIAMRAARSGGTDAIGYGFVTGLFVPFGPTGAGTLDTP